MHSKIIPFLRLLHTAHVDYAKAQVLCAMVENNGRSFGHYSDTLGFNVRTSLNRMVMIGLVRFEAPNYYLTERGQSLANSMLRVYMSGITGVVDAWVPDSDVETRFQLSMQLVERLDRKLRSGEVIGRNEADGLITTLDMAIPEILNGTFTIEGEL